MLTPTTTERSLLLVGPMLGGNPGWVTSQGELLAELFSAGGSEVRLTSTMPNRVLRLFDTVISLLRWARQSDVVILMVFSGPAFLIADLASWVTKLLRRPLVMALHGGNLPDFARRHPRWVERVMRRGDAHLAPTAFLADAFRTGFRDVRIVPNVMPFEDIPYRCPAPARPRLLWMRTFHELYRPEMAVEVLDLVRQRRPDVVLTMAGQDKGLLEPTRALVDAKGLSEHVRFPGFLNHDGKLREFAEHDVFINTNRVDNAPVSVLEAAAFGLPIVATRVGGLPELLRHEAEALLIDDGDASAMAEAVLLLLDDADLVRKLSSGGRAVADRSRWSAVGPMWDDVLGRVSPRRSGDGRAEWAS
jgi:glycosyltransferase involved in cell wall biosynthesis